MWSIIPPGYHDRTTRRFWDVVMRNTGGADPTGSLFPDGIYDIITHPHKTYRTLNYILGGNGPEEANLPSFGTEHAYNGFWTPNNKGFADSEPVNNSNDIISAYLGNGDIRSDLATKYSGIMKDSLISKNTPFEDYISKTYPNKDIQLYEFKLHPSYSTVPTDSIEFVKWQPWKTAAEDDNIQIANGWVPDWAGHYIRRGRLPGHQTTVLQQADIWKFNPEEYDKKYNLDPVSKWGIEQVDNIGNPVVTYTPPYY